jgi:hypothetical protein
MCAIACCYTELLDHGDVARTFRRAVRRVWSLVDETVTLLLFLDDAEVRRAAATPVVAARATPPLVNENLLLAAVEVGVK